MKKLWYSFKRRLSLSYGQDGLGRFLIITSLVFMVLNMFFGLFTLWITALLLYGWYFFRFFSKNFPARQRELALYNGIKYKLKSKLSFYRRKWRERKTHKHFKCRRCSANLRVPKGKGKITVTCPKCGEKIDKKT